MGKPYKIAIGSKCIDGPWGGGNLFVRSLVQGLEAEGWGISFNLEEPDIDIILMTNVFPSESASFDVFEIIEYLKRCKKRPVVVHRMNNSSDARNDPRKLFNKCRILADDIVDHTVFVSDWLRRIYLRDGFDSSKPNTVIHSGGDDAIFKPRATVLNNNRINIVTHHWSTNPKKGFAIYKMLDDLLGSTEFQDRVSFTYIGRLPDGLSFKHAKVLSPLSGRQLGEKLAEFDMYLTASQCEAGGMHYIEAGLSGLPILYINSGGTPEYCDGFGTSFNDEHDFVEKLRQMIKELPKWQNKMCEYPFKAAETNKNYISLFERLLEQVSKNYTKSCNWKRELSTTLLKLKFFYYFRCRFGI